MTATFETQGLVEQLDPAALAAAVAAHEPAAPEATALIKRSSRKSVVALAVCALVINGSAAVYTSPSDFPLLNISSLAELLPRQEASMPKPDPVVAALKDIQSTQHQHTASLQENNYSLQQNAALQQQDAIVLLSLRQSITDERVDVKKISSQLATLIAKIDSLQNTMMSDVTSSIRRAHARYGLSAAIRKRMARQSKSAGPVSVGGAPLSTPATVSAPES
ncbi:putative coiled-coil protein SlyX [Bradyrhizobium sp. LM6.10]